MMKNMMKKYMNQEQDQEVAKRKEESLVVEQNEDIN
jgi:hypothetical protein